MSQNVFGIDLGTTNSAIAWVRNGLAEVIDYEGEQIMPSVVGLGNDGSLLIGTPALNQLAAYPDRTVASIKRKMGSKERVCLSDREFSPEEISALILKELARRASLVTGEEVKQVIITVPAFFRDAQRQATRAAGKIAGLEVLSVINEPTAAALAFGSQDDAEKEQCLLIYDLGGGTFDVSIVASSVGMTEVLASDGDVLLGGDDLDRLIADDLAVQFVRRGHADPRTDPILAARLLQAAEAAKKRLTEDVSTGVHEEFFGTQDGSALHLDLDYSREAFEGLATPLIEKSLDCVHNALAAANRTLDQIDDVLLVGGSTRSPIIGSRLHEITGKLPRRDLQPDLCVALGAAIQGSRMGGGDGGRVLIDVTPYSFGPSHLGELDGRFHTECFTPIIERGTPLPVTRSNTYYTTRDGQEQWDVKIFQGEHSDARKNICVGRFMAEGFTDAPQGNEIICKMKLDLDGILAVEVVEKCSGLAKRITIEGAAAAWSESKLAEARQKTDALWVDKRTFQLPRITVDETETSDRPATDTPKWITEANRLLTRGENLSGRMTTEDQSDFNLIKSELLQAISQQDESAARRAISELDDIVHYIEEA